MCIRDRPEPLSVVELAGKVNTISLPALAVGAEFPLVCSYAPISGNPTIGFPRISLVNPTSTPVFIHGEPVCNRQSDATFTSKGSVFIELASWFVADLHAVIVL